MSTAYGVRKKRLPHSDQFPREQSVLKEGKEGVGFGGILLPARLEGNGVFPPFVEIDPAEEKEGAVGQEQKAVTAVVVLCDYG